jgi:hypothetical protein
VSHHLGAGVYLSTTKRQLLCNLVRSLSCIIRSEAFNRFSVCSGHYCLLPVHPMHSSKGRVLLLINPVRTWLALWPTMNGILRSPKLYRRARCALRRNEMRFHVAIIFEIGQRWHPHVLSSRRGEGIGSYCAPPEEVKIENDSKE